MKETPYLKFGQDLVEPIVDGEKWVTVRFDFDKERFAAGEQIRLVDKDGEPFGEAFATFVTDITIRQFVNQDFDGHKKYDDVEEMISHLRKFYPDADLTPDTEVTLIAFVLQRKLVDIQKKP